MGERSMGTGGELTFRRNLQRQPEKGQEVHGIGRYEAIVIDLQKIPFGRALDLAERTGPAGETRRMEMKRHGHGKKAKEKPGKE
jgi:hypothetical protein